MPTTSETAGAKKRSRQATVVVFVGLVIAQLLDWNAFADGWTPGMGSITEATSVGQARGLSKSVPKEDVAQTREQLDEIYRRVGIQRKRAEDVRLSRQGCTSRRSTQRRSTSKVSDSSTPRLPAALGYLLVALLVLAMLLPLLLSIRRVQRSDQVTFRSVAMASAEPVASPTDSSQATQLATLARCEQLVSGGNEAEALAMLHRIVLVAFEASGALTLDSTATNWQYVRNLAGRPSERKLLAAITEAAERCVLGQHRMLRTDIIQLIAMVREQVG